MPDFLEGFLNILLWTLWIFLFVAYLFILFRIIMDIFRDKSMNGWIKAVWLIALLFLPIITALVYLIARGNSMAQRDVEAADEYHAAQVDYTKGLMKDAAKPATPSDQIAQAKQLLDSGAISEDEYEKLKAKALV